MQVLGTTIGYIDVLILFLLFAATAVIGIIGKNLSYFKAGLRRAPSVDALDEAVRICAEKGRPIYSANFAGGYSATSLSASLVSSLYILEYVAKRCGELGVRMMLACSDHVRVAASTDAIRQGFIASGHPERFNRNDIRYYPHGGIVGAVHIDTILSENVGAALVACWPTNVILEGTYRTGAFSIAFGYGVDHCVGCIIAADHGIFSEEWIAVGTYLSQDQSEIAALIGSDFAKIIMVAITVGYFLLALVGIKI